jgi:hypothetical protein
MISSTILALSLVARLAQPYWLDGAWTGTGYQLGTNGTWAIRLICNPGRGEYSVQYPSLNCGGNLQPVSVEENRVEFIEYITYGTESCIQGGTLVITRVDDRHITYSYFMPGTNVVEAFSTLTREQ